MIKTSEQEKMILEIGERIRKEIKIQRKSANRVRFEAKISPAMISRVIHGTNYNITTLTRILEILDLEIVIQKRREPE